MNCMIGLRQDRSGLIVAALLCTQRSAAHNLFPPSARDKQRFYPTSRKSSRCHGAQFEWTTQSPHEPHATVRQQGRCRRPDDCRSGVHMGAAGLDTTDSFHRAVRCRRWHRHRSATLRCQSLETSGTQCGDRQPSRRLGCGRRRTDGTRASGWAHNLHHLGVEYRELSGQHCPDLRPDARRAGHQPDHRRVFCARRQTGLSGAVGARTGRLRAGQSRQTQFRIAAKPLPLPICWAARRNCSFPRR